MAPLDIPAFVAAWTALYTHFESIGYIPDETVAHPPYTSPPLLLPEGGGGMAEIPLHPLILELLPQLPYPVSYDSSCSFEILPRTRAVPYTVEGELRNARDPLMYYLDEEPRVGEGNVLGAGYLSPEEIVLTSQLPQGVTLILNVAEGTLREYDASGCPPGPERDYHVPDDIDHPRNWPALPAIETIWSYVRKFESLEWIAFEGSTELGILDPSDREHYRLRRILMEEYGWPEAFRKDDWIRERRELRRRLVNELYADFFNEGIPPHLTGQATIDGF